MTGSVLRFLGMSLLIVLMTSLYFCVVVIDVSIIIDNEDEGWDLIFLFLIGELYYITMVRTIIVL